MLFFFLSDHVSVSLNMEIKPTKRETDSHRARKTRPKGHTHTQDIRDKQAAAVSSIHRENTHTQLLCPNPEAQCSFIFALWRMNGVQQRINPNKRGKRLENLHRSPKHTHTMESKINPHALLRTLLVNTYRMGFHSKCPSKRMLRQSTSESWAVCQMASSCTVGSAKNWTVTS